MDRENCEYRDISDRARNLLEKEEGYDVEFKESISGLDNSDLTAFANSDEGGAILLGIKEDKCPNGKQKPVIVGCPIGDEMKQAVISKALSCVPPINVEVIYENMDDRPFIRIEIPPGENKPYGTLGGRYKIRKDGRSTGMRPSMLFNIMIEKEYIKFSKRFKEATRELEDELFLLKGKVSEKMKDLYTNLEKMEKKISESLEHIINTSRNAESLSDESSNLSDETLISVQKLHEKLDNLETSIESLRENLNKFQEI